VSRITADAEIRNGELWLDYPDAFDAKLPVWEGERVRIEVRRIGKRQSDTARGYYRSVVVPAFAAYMREEGDSTATNDDAHEALCFKFLELPPTPIGTPRRRSTSPDEMSDEEFKDFLTKVVIFGRSELHLDIEEPEPDPARRQWSRRRPA
jgi:hypothetical protein